MARYAKDFTLAASPDMIFQAINQYLTSQGYEYCEFEGETVFRKGKAILQDPVCFKFIFTDSSVHLETYMKQALTPGVYIGEKGPTGVMGYAVIAKWKKVIAVVEDTIKGFGCVETAAGTIISGANGTADSPVKNFGNLPAGMTKKDFIKNGISDSLKKSIKYFCIINYVLIGITLIFSLLCVFVFPDMFENLSLTLVFIETGIELALVLGIHLTKNKVFAMILFVLSIIGLILGGGVGNIFWIFLEFITYKNLKKVDDEYKNYVAYNSSINMPGPQM